MSTSTVSSMLHSGKAVAQAVRQAARAEPKIASSVFLESGFAASRASAGSSRSVLRANTRANVSDADGSVYLAKSFSRC
eukprot:CFRG3517T1